MGHAEGPGAQAAVLTIGRVLARARIGPGTELSEGMDAIEPGEEGASTLCAVCGEILFAQDLQTVSGYSCPGCGTTRRPGDRTASRQFQ